MKQADTGACCATTVRRRPCKKRAVQDGRCTLHARQHKCSGACPICLADMCPAGEAVVVGCGHAFHATCLARWVQDSTAQDTPCPLCRAALQPEDHFQTNRTVVQRIASEVAYLPPKQQQALWQFVDAYVHTLAVYNLPPPPL